MRSTPQKSAGVAPEIAIEWHETDTHIVLAVADNGDGIPDRVVGRVLDFSSRTSDKAAYRAPTRGAQGNALKTIMGISIALGNPRSVIQIAGAGACHRLEIWITPAGEVKFEHRREDGPDGGARVAVSFPKEDQHWEPDEWARRFAAFNPHATIKTRKIECGINQGQQASNSWDFSFEPTPNDRFRKFLPTDPTPAHWYSGAEFATLTHLKAARDPQQTVGDYVSEFKGLSARWRSVAAGRPKTIGELCESETTIFDLHAAMIAAAKAPLPEILGRVGPEHLQRHINSAFGVKGDRVWYRHRFGVTDAGTPFLVEIAIAETQREGSVITGLNYSAPFGSDPIADRHLAARDAAGYGIAGFLSECGVFNNKFETDRRRELYTAAIFHMVMPLLPSLDRGKSRLSIHQDIAAAAAEIIAAAAKELTAEHSRWRRQQHRENIALDVEEREERRAVRSQQLTKAEAVNSILLDVYLEQTDGERIYVTARDLYYAVRPIYAEMDVRPSKDGHGRETAELNFKYFAQTVLPEFRRTRHELPFVDYKARGWLILPHSGEEFSIGDKELREFKFPELETNKILFIEKDGVWQTLKQTGGIEFAKRYDMAILAGQGYATVAMRRLLALASAQDWQAFCWHDADPSGYDILRAVAEETKRMPDHRIDVFDLGLTVADAAAMGLQSEVFARKKGLPNATLERLTPEERRLFEGRKVAIGAGKYEWLCERFELNAIPIMERVAYLESKLAEIPNLVGKVVPPDDRLPGVTRSIFSARMLDAVRREVESRIDPKAIAAAAFKRLKLPNAYGDATKDRLLRRLAKSPESTWRSALHGTVSEHDLDRRDIVTAVAEAIAEFMNRDDAP